MRAALVLFALAGPVAAQEWPDGAPVTTAWVAAGESAAELGQITVRNNPFLGLSPGSDEDTELGIDTPFGRVVMHVTSTWNGNCSPACADRYSVVSVPDGYLVIPSDAEIGEEQTGSFLLYRDLQS
jgi:hypothetical protein